jgi:hypothetical protein
MHTSSRLICSLLAAVFLTASASSLQAQSAISLTSFSTYTENFDDLNTAFPSGTYNTATATVSLGTTFPALTTANNPVDPVLIQPGLVWDYTSGATDFANGGFYSRTLTYSANNSTRALRDDAASSDFAFGGKLGTEATLTAQFTNNTGSILSSWNVAYAIEQYSAGVSTTASTVTFVYSLDGMNFITGGSTYSIDATSVAANGNLAAIASTGYSQTVTATVASGDSIYFRWTFFDPATDGRHIGIDDLAVSFSAIPEPSAYPVIAAVASLGLALAHRRRRVR